MQQVLEEVARYLRSACGANFTSYFIGNPMTEKIPPSYLPALAVYAVNSTLETEKLSLQRDSYSYEIKIKVVVNAYSHVYTEEQNDSEDAEIIELKTAKVLEELIENRDTNMNPAADSVLGALRANVTGSKYLFSNQVAIEYPDENIPGAVHAEAIITVSNISRYNDR